MNEKKKYEKMLDITSSTCNITVKKSKKKPVKKLSDEQVKEKLVEKINGEEILKEIENEKNLVEKKQEEFSTANVRNEKKKRFKFNAITVELCVIFLLIGTIFLTSAFIPTSGINNFFSSAFSSKKTGVEDNRTFSDFTPTFETVSEDDAKVENGIINVKNQESVYSPIDGVVKTVFLGNDNKFSVEISHSKNFKTVISGLEYCYVSENEKVFKTIPVGFTRGENISFCFLDGEDKIITDSVFESCLFLWGK